MKISQLHYLFALITAFFMLSTQSYHVNAQTQNGSTKINTCYQSFTVEANKNVKILKTNGVNALTLSDALSNYSFSHFQIWGYDETNQIWTNLDLSNYNFDYNWMNLANPDGTVEYVQIWKPILFKAEISIIPDKILINLFTTSQSYPNGPTTTTLSIANVGVEFVELEDLIEIIQPDNGNTCYTFGNFMFAVDFDQLNLPGFCGELTYKLKLPANAVNTGGLPANYEAEVNTYINGYPLPQSGIQIPATICNGPEQCSPNHTDPCLCIDMSIEVTLTPCPNTDVANCPPIIFAKPIKVCCDCGSVYRPNE